jgi:hypothetical protein
VSPGPQLKGAQNKEYNVKCANVPQNEGLILSFPNGSQINPKLLRKMARKLNFINIPRHLIATLHKIWRKSQAHGLGRK